MHRKSQEAADQLKDYDGDNHSNDNDSDYSDKESEHDTKLRSLSPPDISQQTADKLNYNKNSLSQHHSHLHSQSQHNPKPVKRPRKEDGKSHDSQITNMNASDNNASTTSPQSAATAAAVKKHRKKSQFNQIIQNTLSGHRQETDISAFQLTPGSLSSHAAGLIGLNGGGGGGTTSAHPLQLHFHNLQSR